MSDVVRRSLPSVTGLVALLIAVGWAFVELVGAPVWLPVAFPVVFMAIQYLVGPWVIEWLIPATVIPRSGTGYDTDHRVGALLAARAGDAGIPLPKLGIVDDGNPNAFAFGRSPRGSRVWVTRGLLERLDEHELDAVLAHEVGHIKHWDMAVMTVAALIPMVLYWVYAMARSGNDKAKTVALGAYISHLVARLVVLALSRSRELAADHWSCAVTGNGDALAAALVKVAYGMGEVRAAEQAQAKALVASGKEGKKQAARIERQRHRMRSMNIMGISSMSDADAMAAAFGAGIEPQRAMAALRWDLVNPWARVLEALSTHPLVAHRIAALEDSGLPGAPRAWSVLRARAAGGAGATQEPSLWGRFWGELFMAVAPWATLIAVSVLGRSGGDFFGPGLAAAGILFFLKQVLRYPSGYQPVAEIAGLLEVLEASPVAGIPVEVRGTIAGRGLPGYVLSPDMVVTDASGFVPLLYRNPLPFGEAWFSLARVRGYLGQEVVARGWYRRMPSPVIELRDVRAADGRVTRCWEWALRYTAAIVLLVAGVLTTTLRIAV